MIAFSTFVAGGIALKWEDIEKAFGPNKVAFVLGCMLLFVALIASLISLWFTFRSINPFLKSGNIPAKYHSVLFFEDVATFPSAEGYQAAVQHLGEKDMIQDLTFQTHILAQGLSGKFANLRLGMWWILYLQLPALGLIVLELLIVVTVNLLQKATQ